ncbi:hypothetical protein BGZ95_006366 [Linnemannia exigua]|uniref:Alcohol dehydrogenase n=1 Tax=Linnemannia exigua TaxID=604196 RepID=A0AAD4DGF9_9FUNG|nr:hypothetical protein BGZ95_006366 [Linnemannia exigua]
MTTDKTMTSPPPSQQQTKEESQETTTKTHQPAHCGVDDKTTFTGYATSGGTTLHKITFSPRTLGPKDVEINIWYSAICGSDLHLYEKDWCKLHGEVVPGHQIAGTVAAAGPEALHKVGDRVGACLVIDACMECDECKAGHEQHCAKKTTIYKDTFKDGSSAPSYGGFANRIRLCSEFVYKVPDEIHLSEAAPLFCAGLTTYTALCKYCAGADKAIGVMGIGALGHLAIQFAKAMGSKEIVAITDSDVNPDDLNKLGATRCIDSSNKDQVKAEHHKIDLLLINSFDKSTNWEDILSLDPIQIPTMPFVHRDLKIVSSFQGGRKDVKEMLAFSAKHNIRPWIVKTPFDKINDAMELQRQKTARYCIVLEADKSKEKGSNVEADKPEGGNVEALKPVAEQYLKD